MKRTDRDCIGDALDHLHYLRQHLVRGSLWAMRNCITHSYGRVEFAVIRSSIENDLPRVESELRAIFAGGQLSAQAAKEDEDLGIARIAYGPLPQRASLLALRDLANDLYGTGVIPLDLPSLN